MKKNIIIVFVIFVLLCSVTACSKNTEKGNSDDRLSIVATIFPEYDWVANILKENSESFNVSLLLDNGVDLHSYQPTADDIVRISKCDLFIYVGGESDEWVEQVLQESVNKNMVVINLLEVLGDSVKVEELKEGMQSKESEESEGEVEYDEHVWLSLKNARTLVSAICDGICRIDEKNADTYRKNASDYNIKLKLLDEQYREMTEKAKSKTLVFGDRFPFRYLMDDYNLDYYAAFAGCSAESEASFETIVFLANKLDTLRLHYILVLDKSQSNIAQTVVSISKNKDAEVLTMDSMQSTISEDIKNGATYYSIMEKNLEVLKLALQ